MTTLRIVIADDDVHEIELKTFDQLTTAEFIRMAERDDDPTDATLTKDKAKLNPINLTLADIQNLEIANGHEATDEEVLKVIQKGVKTRRETAKLYEDKGLADKAAPETAEADFLETFLPAAASDEDYAKAVADAVAEVNPAGPKDMGRVVKAARAALAGKTIDGGKLAGLVKAELNK